MAIQCKICGQEFKKIITHSHLKKHDMTTADYKKQYGKESLSCPEYRKERSEKYSGNNNPNFGNKWTDEMKSNASDKLKGREAWNKGIKATEEQKQKLSTIMKEKYASGELEVWCKGMTRDEEYRDKISQGVKRYAKENNEKLAERGKKAYQTKIENYGEDFVKEQLQNIRSNISEEGKQRQKEALIRV